MELQNLTKEQMKALRKTDVSGMLPEEVPNLFVTLAQQIHHESVINGLDMASIIECFNELQEAYKKERSNYRFDGWIKLNGIAG